MAMDAAAYPVFILNISHTLITKPSNEKYQRDLNEGRYDGSAPKWFRNEIRLSDP